jgi:HYR domain-containing protein
MKITRKDRSFNIIALIVMLAGLLSSPLTSSPAYAMPSPLGGNGQDPRPFYNFGHNPNEIDEATEAINGGANALEPDLMHFPNPTCLIPILGDISPSGLYMYHDPSCPTRKPATVESWLQNLHTMAKNGSNLALIAFDIKTGAADYLKGSLSDAAKLQNAVNTYLNYDGVQVNIIYSVGSTGDADNFFDYLCIGNREGIMVDADNDPSKIYNFLKGKVATASVNCNSNLPLNLGYGDGAIGESTGAAPHILTSIAEASWIRASQGKAFAIPYAFPITTAFGTDRVNEYITAGADGLIPDDDFILQDWLTTMSSIFTLGNVIQSRSDEIYLATAADDPFNPSNEAYALRIDTRDNGNYEGTDSDLTFVLNGCAGSASVTVDASFQASPFWSRFEDGDRDYVTIFSKDIGALQSIQLKSDGTGDGPDWEPGLVQISSSHYGIPLADNRTVDFSGEVVSPQNSPIRSLGGWGNPCDNTPPIVTVPGNMTVEATSAAGAVVSFNATATDETSPANPAVTCLPASGSTFALGTATVNCSATDDHGNTGTNSFTITVQDTTPPTITLPAAISVPQMLPGGAVVTYGSVSATDAVGPANPTVTCTPASGSTFPVGTTAVDCSAKDTAGNTGHASFNVTVVPSIPLLKNGGFDQGTQNWSFLIPDYTLAKLFDCKIFLSPGCSIKFNGVQALRLGTQTIIRNGVAGDLFSFGVSSRTQNIPSDGTYKADVMFYNNNNSLLYSKTLSFNTGSHDFQMANTSFILPVNYSKIVYQITLQESTGTAWFDDAFLYLIP